MGNAIHGDKFDIKYNIMQKKIDIRSRALIAQLLSILLKVNMIFKKIYSCKEVIANS